MGETSEEYGGCSKVSNLNWESFDNVILAICGWALSWSKLCPRRLTSASLDIHLYLLSSKLVSPLRNFCNHRRTVRSLVDPPVQLYWYWKQFVSHYDQAWTRAKTLSSSSSSSSSSCVDSLSPSIPIFLRSWRVH